MTDESVDPNILEAINAAIRGRSAEATAALGRVRGPEAVKPPHFIREWRKARGVSLDQLAVRLGASKQVVSMLERGQRELGMKHLSLISAALNVPPGQLLAVDPATL